MKQVRFFCLIVSIFIFLSASWALFYYLLGKLADFYGLTLNPLVHHVVSSLIGMFVFIALTAVFGRFHEPKKVTYFQAITQALRQIAKGNFKIDLDVDLRVPGPHVKNNPFVQLVDSVHYMAKELEQLERVRQEFISNVSHEIQSPLTSIKGFARALENDQLTRSKRDHYLQIIRMEADRLSKLSDNLLKLTSLEHSKNPVTKVRYRPDRQIRNCLLAFEPQWRRKKIHMNIDLDPITLYADSELMNQVWTNLIHNGIKFTPEGGTIDVSLKQVRNTAIFAVSDSGIGIRPEDRLHLFERFYKADRSRNRSEGGNGLGLSIVRKIVDVHHGHIFVDSEFGKGTTVTVSFDHPEG